MSILPLKRNGSYKEKNGNSGMELEALGGSINTVLKKSFRIPWFELIVISAELSSNGAATAYHGLFWERGLVHMENKMLDTK